ncbi:CheR family methyltransferase [Pseudooceanicola sp. LIPI14-2-Ac024]|uniref:CheR family methyltransferase n=1 Tax=Pseudooceanicola sp. LIPI14-2-Ac024 TaxID=3344875 RepID=UPI0035D0F665
MSSDEDLPWVIGITASAGGLEAITALVQALPARTGASYIIAQHMSPTHKSLMSVLVARETQLPVVELTGDVTPAPDTIYVTPPNSDVVFKGGMIRLIEPAGRPGSPKPSADRLFYAMADELGDRCIAVVLSGTGSDGSYGVQAVREAGGITLAQDQSTAKYSGMPTSAVETGCIDIVLPPEKIGEHITKIMAEPRNLEALKALDEMPGGLTEILQILLARSQVDFRDYKDNTVQRRIQRRMTALGISSYDDYVAHCRTRAGEIDALYADLLISVTRFFRDPNQFERLGIELRNLVEGREASEPLRVWVAGCATGEEAYSVAILIAEAFGGLGEIAARKVQIFATDIDEAALRIGRRGDYPAAAADDIPAHLLDRYFDRTDTKITVKTKLKQMILFSHHNVFQDPPFINIDLVTLRNLLIYFKPRLQERVLSRVHYALKPRGLLFLGTSEAIGPMQIDYEVMSERNRLFRKRSQTRPGIASRIGEFQSRDWRMGGGLQSDRTRASQDDARYREMFESLARGVGGDAMLVSTGHEIIRVFGSISEFVALDESTKLNLSLSLLKSPLRDEAPSLCTIALKTGRRRRGARHEMPGTDRTHVCLEAFPIDMGEDAESYVLLSVQPLTLDTAETVLGADAAELSQLRQLEADVASTRAALQQTIEELQTSNEEQQSLNEELQSTNEDLQATNEELETSNEELQSSNEELLTVNEELQINASELEGVRQDIESVLQSAPLAILVIDNAMQVSRCSAPARRKFRIEAGLDLVHLSQCRVPEGYPSLVQIATETFGTREPQIRHFQSGNTFVSLRSVPYFNQARDLRGVTIVLSEVDSEELNAKMQMVEAMTEIGHWKLDLVENRIHWSDRVFAIHGRARERGVPSLDEALAYYLPEDMQIVTSAMENTIATGEPYDFRLRIRREDGRLAHVESRGTVQFDLNGKPVALIGVFADKDREIGTEMLLHQFGQAHDKARIGFYSIDIANDQVFFSPSLYRILGLDPARDDPSIDALLAALTDGDRDAAKARFGAAMERGEAFDLDSHLPRPGRDLLPCHISGMPRSEPHGPVSHVFGLISF